MTLHDLTTAACIRLQHAWELHGPTLDPATCIPAIVLDAATAPCDRAAAPLRTLEDARYDYWTALTATVTTDPRGE